MTVDAPAPPIRQLQLLLTERCNLGCTHCAVPAEESVAQGELSTGEWRDFIDVALAGGIDRFVFSGGEALLRPDCLELTAWALRAGAAQVVLVTNGTALSAAVCSDLAELQRSASHLHVHISIDGAGPPSHDLIRGSGTFVRSVRGAERLLAAGGRVDAVHTVLHKANVDELDELERLARRWGARTWTVFPLAALGRGRHLDDQRLKQAEWEHVLATLARRGDQRFEIAVMGPTIGDEWTRVDLIPRARSRHARQAVVGPDGAVFTCPPLRSTGLGLARDVAASGEWAPVSAAVSRQLTVHCPTCRFRPLCTGVDPDQLEPAPSSGPVHQNEDTSVPIRLIGREQRIVTPT